MLISERNKESRKQNRAAVTVILEDRLARLIFRYEGKAIDFSVRDERIDSLRQYFVETVSAVADGRIYMLTTGYNRNELDIRDITPAEKPAIHDGLPGNVADGNCGTNQYQRPDKLAVAGQDQSFRTASISPSSYSLISSKPKERYSFLATVLSRS